MQPLHWLGFGMLIWATCLGTGRATEPEPAGGLDRFDALIKAADRRHWAFQAVPSTVVPVVDTTGWPQTPVDRFLLAQLEKQRWQPASPVDSQALLRRLYLDLTGLPPTPAEQEAFLRDRSPGGWDRVVQDLLARPAYGERWGRHWLDLVRYAESNGYERDAAKPHVWRYRDYVIQSFNADKPFDRFILEQLAGDELPDADSQSVVATGFYRLGPWDDEPADPKEDRCDQLDDMVNTTAQVFLGLTLSCARCHNHKFEALTMHDYYRMVAVFQPLQRPRNGRAELDVLATPIKDRLTGSGAPFLALGSPVRSLAVCCCLAPILTGPRAYIMEEPGRQPPPTHLLTRGQAARPGPQVEPGVPAVLAPSQPRFPSAGPYTSQRRLTLARWIASPDNPLTARVIVNRVWQFHFGAGLVRTPSDFGIMGDAPTHPELLDWLAEWFVKEGWSIKKLHRLILTSNAYRMSKRWNSEYGAEDTENRLLWRFPYRRLEVEAIRDSVLAVSGRLNRAMYGPSVFPPVPHAALEGNSDPDKIWKPSPEADASRRTVYVFVKRSMVLPFLEVLDFCDTARTAPQRNITSVAPQALTLFNSEFINQQAGYFAARLEREAGPDRQQQIELAYRLALCRSPTVAEKAKLARFLDDEAAHRLKEVPTLLASAARHHALVQLCRVVFNLNEFVYPD
jgi:hypothetical protein